MKNREKYKNELMNVIKMDGKICGFMKKHDVFRMIGTDWESFCEMDCIACGTALQIWLDEEYKNQKVDWDNVPVDTLVRVRNSENETWRLRHFAGFFEYDSLKYATWNDGRSSKTKATNGDYCNWKYCELVEVEDE